MQLYTGCIENRDDPLKLGRCQVRIVGIHTHDKSILPTEDLPWAHPMQPLTSAGLNGIGWTPTGPVLGTWVIIMFRDDDQQQPIMLGSIGGIPQSKAAEIASEQSSDNIFATEGGVLVDSEGNPVVDGSGNPIGVGSREATGDPTAPPAAVAPPPDIREQPVPNAASDAALKQNIPTKPPAGSTPNVAQAEQNIKLLIEACDQVGLNSKYAKAAILGICGGESGWLPVEEYTSYTKEALMRIFPRTFPPGSDSVAAQYAKWDYKVKGREEFFKKIYNPAGQGVLLGHKDPDDGAKYYGRGFNQITGKSLYKQLQDFLKKKGINVDLVNNPKSIVDDPKTCALATVAFYALNVKHDPNDPGYFIAARKRTGADAGGGYAKKQKYYEYFLGDSVAVEPTNKPMADVSKVYTKAEVKDEPPAKQAALLENRSDVAQVGFKDPQGKYPLRHLLDEPDTNRLARGVIKETAIEYKDSSRSKQIPMANSESVWEQPIAPFGGMYPYNKVYETESGHLLMMDDTPTHENISLYHRKGTFLDIDANGTQVNKIVGDGYTIIDRNGSIYIAGEAKVTVGNGINILVQGDANVQVNGGAVINLKNKVEVNAAADLNLTVGGNMKTKVGGEYTLEVAGNINQTTSKSYHTKSKESMFITSDASMDIKSSAKMSVDYSEGQFGNGANAAAIVPTELTFIEEGVGVNGQYQYLQTPVRPSPPVKLKYTIDEENVAKFDDYVQNPDKYKNPVAEQNGVKPNYPGTPKTDGGGKSLISDAEPGDLYLWLRKQLELTEQQKYWRETGQNGNPSNPNITRIWADLGYPNTNYWRSDQTAWCMGFVNYALKQCGYRYVQEAGARAIQANPGRWGAKQVTPAEAQPGDIVLWNFGHVNFVYTANNGKLTFVGGNQSPKLKGNNPNDGDVTQSWPNGWTAANGGIVGIWRPSKT